MYHILVCDDEKDIVSAIRIYLEAEGYVVHPAYNGKQALELARQQTIHLILLDLMMPEMDGITAMTELRKTQNTPIILLTAKSEDTDKVLGLNMGADDYITKPFNPVELLARVRSQLRRYLMLGGEDKNPNSGVLNVGAIRMNEKTRTVTVDGESVSLTHKEYEILRELMEHPGELFSPKELYRRVWRDDPYGGESTVAVHIRHLREKLEINPAEPRYLKVVWGQGYKLESEEHP